MRDQIAHQNLPLALARHHGAGRQMLGDGLVEQPAAALDEFGDKCRNAQAGAGAREARLQPLRKFGVGHRLCAMLTARA